MFAKLKKKIAEEAATTPRSGVRIPRTISKESIASMGADSGDDFASDGSNSRDDLPAQILRRNDQIRKLEAKLSASIKKLQEQNESHQVSRTRMVEGMALALEKKDQEWMEKMAVVEKLLQKEEHLSQGELELEEVQQKEAEVKGAKRGLSEVQGELQALQHDHEESLRLNSDLEIEREELLLLKQDADRKMKKLQIQCQELQSVVKQVSEDFQKSQDMVSTLEGALHTLQTEHDALKLKQEKAAVTEEDKEHMITGLQKKVTFLERWLYKNLSEDENLQELLKEKSSLEVSLEESRAELLALRTDHADTVNNLEAQISRMCCRITELQTLLQHKDDSSRNYRERTDAQIANLEKQVMESDEKLSGAEKQMTEKQQHLDELIGEWSSEKLSLQQQLTVSEQQTQEETRRLQQSITSLQSERQILQDRVEELVKQGTESTEIAETLVRTQQERERLQAQVGELNESIQASQQGLAETTEVLAQRDENIKTLENETQCLKSSVLQLQEEKDHQRAQQEQLEQEKESQLTTLREKLLTQTQHLDSFQARILYLEVEMETLTEQLHRPEVCEEDENVRMTGDDLDQIQKHNRELEQQLGDKNRTIKQLQQRMAELKRTLQKELRMKSEPDAEAREKSPEIRAERHESVCPDPPPASSQNLTTFNTKVINTADLNDSREINLEYLKHVVLKFMSSREAEAFQLIRAVSVLLNFTREEEEMLKQTLEYKMSWFGSKPSPKGIIRPSVSGSLTHWS
ncbi:golgin subfamily A member 1 isoform X2 [Nelusetta ayraudi]|uniref:golgin subfamily A member 1 isoform X2 n=1 Tax=Nelusetta ayraudi TaxID=303726 RepID=UPI003F6F1D1A